MAGISIRYIVGDVSAAREFYERNLGLTTLAQFGPGFAMLERDGIKLMVNAPGAGGAGQAMPDGRKPEPGGWNRMVVEVDDLEATVARIGAAGATFRNAIVQGNGGKQILVEDPSGNPVELLEPKRG